MMASENKQHSSYPGVVLLKLILNSIIQAISQTREQRDCRDWELEMDPAGVRVLLAGAVAWVSAAQP